LAKNWKKKKKKEIRGAPNAFKKNPMLGRRGAEYIHSGKEGSSAGKIRGKMQFLEI